MNDIISKLLLKWFEWKMKSIKGKTEKLNINKQKELKKNIDKSIHIQIDDILLNIQEEIECMWSQIEYDVEDAMEDSSIWCSEDE